MQISIASEKNGYYLTLVFKIKCKVFGIEVRDKYDKYIWINKLYSSSLCLQWRKFKKNYTEFFQIHVYEKSALSKWKKN